MAKVKGKRNPCNQQGHLLYTLSTMAKVDEKERKRLIVEEVGAEVPKVESEETPLESSTEVVSSETKEPLEVVKEKVEELQTLTEGISESVEKSVEVQEELAMVAEKVIPTDKPDDFIPLEKNSRGPNPLLIIIPGVLLLGALLGGIVFYRSSVDNQKNIKDTELTETPAPTEIAEDVVAISTPSATIDLSKYTVVILNGSGISGEAGKVKTILTAAEFKVGTTGNASTYDYTKTVVKAKSTVDATFVTKLIETLGKTYVVDKAQTLSDSSKDDVQVVVGTSKK